VICPGGVSTFDIFGRSDRCLSVLSVMPCPVYRHVYDIAVLWPNGWTDQDETWRAGRPRRWPHVLDGDPAAPPPKGHIPQFLAHICCGQMVGWIKMSRGVEVGLSPSHIVLDGHPAPPYQKMGTAPSQFSAHVCCGQTSVWIKVLLGTEVGLDPGSIVLYADRAPPPTGHSQGCIGGVYTIYQPPVYFAGVYSPQLPYMNRVYTGYVLSPSKRQSMSYDTKMNSITSQHMVFFQGRNALKTVFGRGFAPNPTGGAYDVPSDPLVGWGGGTHSPSPRCLQRLGPRRLGRLVRCMLTSIFSNTPLARGSGGAL